MVKKDIPSSQFMTLRVFVFLKRIRGRRIYDNAIEKLKFYAKSVIFYANNYFLEIICYITFEIKMKNWR